MICSIPKSIALAMILDLLQLCKFSGRTYSYGDPDMYLTTMKLWTIGYSVNIIPIGLDDYKLHSFPSGGGSSYLRA